MSNEIGTPHNSFVEKPSSPQGMTTIKYHACGKNTASAERGLVTVNLSRERRHSHVALRLETAMHSVIHLLQTDMGAEPQVGWDPFRTWR